ncbi:MAG TPA: hypothetical protein VHZ24_03105 [Pirellulales bacterium]|jgi:hypothetical protein|nr:hypothetical protein [Pirellulales bacterium]
MPHRTQPFNPFYVIVVIAGVAFSVTACAYGVMCLRDLRAAAKVPAEPESCLMQVMRRHGDRLLATEIAVLGLASLAAMGTDRYWQRRAAQLTARRSDTPLDPPTDPLG